MSLISKNYYYFVTRPSPNQVKIASKSIRNLVRQKFNYKSNYKILNLVGRGQFGKVFVAIERSSGTLVALKELNSQQLSTSSFLRELNFLVTLDHLHIVNCRALEHHQNHRYLVLDYCEGGTLRDLMQSPSALTLDQSLQLIINILSGLQFAHGKGIIHRDIKPENILLKIGDRGWTAHISDFGIAKLNQEINPHSVMGDTGSPAYMAPEQFYGQYSYSCDLYAVGIILYELVVGERPFTGMPKELLAAHLNQTATIPPQVPFILRSAIAKSLQKLPHRRFRHAAEMLESLQLAQAILQADKGTPVTNLIEPQQKLPNLKATSTARSTPKTSYLAIAAELVLLGDDHQLQLQLYQDENFTGAMVAQWIFTLDRPICNLQLNTDGCWVTTQSSLYYIPLDTTGEEFRFLAATVLPVASLATEKLVSGIDPSGYWLAMSYLPQKSRTPVFEIYQAPNCQLWRSQINRKPWHRLIVLNQRQGLAIYQHPNQQTEFSLFNRRGNWLATFTLQIQLDSILFNPQFDQQILATEQSNLRVVVLIFLAQLRVKRLQLDLVPSILVSCPQGYLLADHQGKIALVDGDTYQVNHYQLPVSSESQLTAIAVPPGELSLWVAFVQGEQSYLQRFALPGILAGES